MFQLVLLFLVLMIALAVLCFAAARANELFVLEARSDRVEHRRGRIPPRLLGEISDLLQRTDSHGVIKVTTREGQPYLSVKGSFSAELTQQIRNVVGLYPIAKIRAGKKPR